MGNISYTLLTYPGKHNIYIIEVVLIWCVLRKLSDRFKQSNVSCNSPHGIHILNMNSWYKSTKEAFLTSSVADIYFQLDKSARLDGYSIELEQKEEWEETILSVKEALKYPGLDSIKGVLLEYNFRRRGLRIDFVLLAPGITFVLEFKRGDISGSARDQVMRYAKNLIEFHELTQSLAPIVYPILITREGDVVNPGQLGMSRNRPNLNAVPLSCHVEKLGELLKSALDFLHKEGKCPTVEEWDSAAFSPSTQIIDAAITLYGGHDVTAIKEHANSAYDIAKCSEAVKETIRRFTSEGVNGIIVVTGQPGAGKTLVGLNTVFSKEFMSQSVFVTGNAPLVSVLTAALSQSYRKFTNKKWEDSLAGFPRDEDSFIEDSTTFNIVCAHHFLGDKDGQ